ncbi:MAG: DUF4307 domain-containing protein [Actinomycetota bacterium]|nr:DUF4307 domain-containing protein [Actinomycetota bacterium]
MSSPDAPPGRPPGRYGEPSAHRRGIARGLTALLAVALVGYVVWVGLHHARQPVAWGLLAYQVVDEHRTKVTIEVRRPAGTRVLCTVRAVDRDRVVVGSVEAALDSSGPATRRMEVEVPTRARAALGQLTTCRIG